MNRADYYCELLNKLYWKLLKEESDKLQGEANDLLAYHKSNHHIEWNLVLECFIVVYNG